MFPVTEHKNNEGGTRLVPASQLTRRLNESISGDPVISTTLHQLLHFTQASTVIIKIDVEVRGQVRKMRILSNFYSVGF